MSRLIKNWSYLLFSDITQAVLNFFVFMLLARKLSPEGFGEFNVIMAVVAIFTVVANNFSANHVATREITLNPEGSKELTKKLIVIRFFSFLLSVIAIAIYLNIKGDTRVSIILFSTLLVLANSLWDISESIVFGFFVTKYTTLFNIIFSIIWLSIVFFIPENILSASIVLIIYSSLYVFRGLSYFFTFKLKFIKGRKNASSLTYKSILLMSFPYLGMRLFGVFADQIPILLLESKSGNQEVAFFSVGFRLIIPITLAVNTGLRAVFPFMTKLYNEDKKEFASKLTAGFEFVLLWGTIISCILVLSSQFWIPLFLGQAYLHSIDTFNILAWFGVGMCFDLILSTVLSSTYKQNTLAILTTIDFILLFPMYYFGAMYGAVGLAIAKLGGMLVVLVYHIIVVQKVLKININSMSFYLSLLFYILMMGATLFFENLYLKVIGALTILTIYIVYKPSPLRANIKYLVGFLKKT